MDTKRLMAPLDGVPDDASVRLLAFDAPADEWVSVAACGFGRDIQGNMVVYGDFEGNWPGMSVPMRDRDGQAATPDTPSATGDPGMTLARFRSVVETAATVRMVTYDCDSAGWASIDITGIAADMHGNPVLVGDYSGTEPAGCIGMPGPKGR